jgi:hypothetical protein
MLMVLERWHCALFSFQFDAPMRLMVVGVEWWNPALNSSHFDFLFLMRSMVFGFE